MKKVIVILSMVGMLITANSVVALSQDKPKPKKDTVNMDTNAKPTYYYAVEDDKPAKKEGAMGVIEISVIAAVIVLVVGGVAFFLIKRTKK